MITSSEQAYICEHAYVPEHLPHYVTAISQTESFIIGDFVVHVAGSKLVFVGYPLCGNLDDARMLKALDEAKARFEPAVVSIVAPALSIAALKDCMPSPPDVYYRLELSQLVLPKKTGDMLKRARRELSVSTGKFRWGHKRLLKHFMRKHRLDNATRFIFERVSKYAKCDNVVVFDARNAQGDLIAFDIADYSARQYAFYMFNCRSHKYNIPGASDLLLAHVIERAQAEGKRHLNLGLGIDSGIAFFKKKWGATPFLECVSCVQECQTQQSLGGLFDRLS
jgi:hypothetical protein